MALAGSRTLLEQRPTPGNYRFPILPQSLPLSVFPCRRGVELELAIRATPLTAIAASRFWVAR